MDQKANHDKGAKLRTFQVDDQVYIKNFARGAVWVPGVITAPNGPLSYLVKLHDGRIWKRYVDHVRSRWQDDQTMPLPQDYHDSDHDWDFTDNPPVEEGNEMLHPGHSQLAPSQSGQSNSGQLSFRSRFTDYPPITPQQKSTRPLRLGLFKLIVNINQKIGKTSVS